MVHCSACGRSYPAARFSGGRALHCACGARVGRTMRTGIGGDPPSFFADSMLGGLARWLRALGYDTAWEPDIEDADLVRRGTAEGRWILTRDRGLADEWWVDSLLLLTADRPLAQLAEVHRRLPLDPAGLFTRCTRCNTPLRPAAVRRAYELPPEHRDRPETATECPGCGRLYWQGSHVRRMRDALEGALGRDAR